MTSMMPPAKLQVSVVTPIRQVARIEVDMVTAPSALGEVGILPDHRPLLADLKPGQVTLSAGKRADRFAISGGFIEVDRNHVTILAETAEASDEIDLERARKALKAAETKLTKLESDDEEYARQQARAERARVRIGVATGA
jgi:F-type H+-transporting ATPase subunit epsilon